MPKRFDANLIGRLIMRHHRGTQHNSNAIKRVDVRKKCCCATDREDRADKGTNCSISVVFAHYLRFRLIDDIMGSMIPFASLVLLSQQIDLLILNVIMGIN